MRKSRFGTGRWIVGAAFGITGLIGAAAVPAGAASVHEKQDLKPTVLAPGASGKVALTVTQRSTGLRGKMRVRVRNVGHAGTFAVNVGGVRIGTLTTNAAGNGSARFSSTPSGHDQLLGVDPRGKSVEVADDETGEDHLTGDVPDDSVDPNDVRCCVANGGETECESMTHDECVTHAGTDLGAGTCLPDPCPNASPGSGDEIRCCKPEDRGMQCDATSAAECTAENGTNIGAGACDVAACGGTPPTVVRCCVPEDGGQVQQCEHMTGDHCAAHGGRDLGPGACDPDPCQVGSPSGAFVGARPAF